MVCSQQYAWQYHVPILYYQHLAQPLHQCGYREDKYLRSSSWITVVQHDEFARFHQLLRLILGALLPLYVIMALQW